MLLPSLAVFILLFPRTIKCFLCPWQLQLVPGASRPAQAALKGGADLGSEPGAPELPHVIQLYKLYSLVLGLGAPSPA